MPYFIKSLLKSKKTAILSLFSVKGNCQFMQKENCSGLMMVAVYFLISWSISKMVAIVLSRPVVGRD